LEAPFSTIIFINPKYNLLVKQLTAPLAIFRHFAARHSGIGPAVISSVGHLHTMTAEIFSQKSNILQQQNFLNKTPFSSFKV